LVGPGSRQRLLFTDVRWPLMRWYFTTTAIWQTRKRERTRQGLLLLLVRSSSKDTILLLSHYHEAGLRLSKGRTWVGPDLLSWMPLVAEALIVAISRAQVKHAVCDLVTIIMEGYVAINRFSIPRNQSSFGSDPSRRVGARVSM
jgi:hypothetical protein